MNTKPEKNLKNPLKAVGLFSGGLESLLASLIVRSLGFNVIALTFDTGFTGLKPSGKK